MIYLFDGELGCSIVYNKSYLTPELLSMAVEVAELPIPEERLGFDAVLRCNYLTQEVWFDYLPQPVIEEVVE